VDYEEQELAEMKAFTLSLALIALLAGQAGAQTNIPAGALVAEGEARWADALRLYRAQLEREPGATEPWLRIADIEARLGRASESIAALEHAAAARPSDASISSRLSQAYAAQGHAVAALHAIEGALAVQPLSEEYLRAHATLATWAGNYDAAARSYRKLRQAHPQDTDLALALARVSVWNADSDAAASAYRDYLNGSNPLPEAWLELARTESWRGNVIAAVEALEQYGHRFGATDAYLRERVYVLARTGRPREALRDLAPLLAAAPNDYELQLSRTVALASLRRHGAAASSLAGIDALKPDHTDTRAAESLVRSLLGSNVGPSTTFYNDSDGLQVLKAAPRFDVGFKSDTRFHGGYELIELEARIGSGLEHVSGGRSAKVEHGWTGLTQRIGALTLGGTVGQARAESHSHNTYAAFVKFTPADTVAVSAERSSGFATISPRTASLGITKITHRSTIDWAVAMRYHVALEAAHEELSDGNARWEVLVAPRAAVARTQRLNLDVGLLLHQFGARHNLDHGYYDPRRYEYYAVVVSPYWKVSDDIGVGASAGLGGQRDDSDSRFRLGSNASAEATFGIYGPWLLKVHGSTTNNWRLDSGAFRGVSGGIVLLRRF
jgi:tetratricopeptide (TPR) repeat protein